MKTSESTKNINKALFNFQGIMPKIKRNAKNSHFKSTYITWDDLADAVIPKLQECGLYFEQEEGEVDGYVTVSTRITHADSGEYKQYSPYRIKETTSGNQDHNAGKSTTYAQKRSLVLALGIRGTDEDTDGNDMDPPVKRQEKNVITPKQKENMPENYKETVVCGAQTDLQRKHDDIKRKQAHKRFMTWCKHNVNDEIRLKAIKRITGKDSSKDLTIDEMKTVHAGLEKYVDMMIDKGAVVNE